MYKVFAQTHCHYKPTYTQRVKFILYIYIIFMWLDFVLSIVIMEMAVFLLKIQRYAQ